MVTINDSTIGGTTPDYSTIALWESATDNDLVTADTIERGLLRNAAFAENVAWTGATTDSTRYRVLMPDSGAKHTGTFGTGARVGPTTGHAFEITSEDAHIYDIEVTSGGNTSDEAIRNYADTLTLKRNLFKMGSQSGSQGDAVYTAFGVTTTITAENNIWYGFDRDVYGEAGSGTVTLNDYHSTAISFSQYYVNNTGTSTYNIKGCLIDDPGAECLNAGGTPTWNITDVIMAGTTARTGTNLTQSATFQTGTGGTGTRVMFTNMSTQDYSLVDNASNAAQNHVNSARTTVTDDYLDDSRPAANHDAGADEYVSGGTTIACTADSLTFTKNNVTIDYDVTVACTAGSLTLTKNNATVDNDVIVACTAGSLTLAVTGNQETNFHSIVESSVGVFPTLQFTPQNATVNLDVTVAAGVGSLTLTPQNATVDYDVIVAQALTSVLTLSALNASVLFGNDVTVACTAGSLTLTKNNASTTYAREIQAGVETLTLTPYNVTLGTTSSIWQKWGYLIDNMEWQGKKILSGVARMTAPPGSPSTHTFWHNFITLPSPDDRSIRVIARWTESSESIIDWWFFCYWGHTGTSRYQWPGTHTPGPITIAGAPFFEWGEGRPVRVATHFASGHAVVDRIRMVFDDDGVITTDKVSNYTNTGSLLPFYTHPEAPSWCTDKALTLQNEIFVDKGSNQKSMKNAYTGDDREQFVENEWCYEFPGRTGAQERFGVNHLGVDVWAGGDKREEAWWMVLRKHMNQLGNFVDPVTGNLPNWLTTYNQLVLDETEVRPDSTGWNSDPAKGQNWFNHTTAPQGQFNWMSRDPKTGERWRNFNQQHWGIVHLCQYYDRHKDPGAYWMILHLQNRWIAGNPTENRGNTKNKASSHRGRGRIIASAACMYMITQDADLFTRMEERLVIDMAAYDADVATYGVPYPSNGSSWETGIWCTGLLMVTQPSIPLNAGLRAKVEAAMLELAKFVLLCWYEYETDKWGLPYQSLVNGAPKPGQSTNSALWNWAIVPIMWLKLHKMSSLTLDQQTKVNNIYAYRYTNHATGPANVWHEDWEDFYGGTGKTGTSAINMLIPTVSGRGQKGTLPPAYAEGVGDINMLLPTMTAAATVGRTGSSQLHIPLLTMTARGIAKGPASTLKVGSGDLDVLIPTMAAVGVLAITGTGDMDVLIPTMTAEGTVTNEKMSVTNHTGTGSKTTFLIGFPYLSTDHIVVTVDGVAQVQDGVTMYIDDTGENVVFGTAPDSGVAIQISRVTPHEPYIGFTDGGPVDFSDFSKAFRQLLYVVEEVQDSI